MVLSGNKPLYAFPPCSAMEMFMPEDCRESFYVKEM
jgi:hypothetical protein